MVGWVQVMTSARCPLTQGGADGNTRPAEHADSTRPEEWLTIPNEIARRDEQQAKLEIARGIPAPTDK